MTMFYSQSTHGFYDSGIHVGNQIPHDAVEITVEEWQALLEGQASGQVISADANGNPVLVTPAGPTLSQAQDSGLKQIDIEAEALRGVYITANSGQVATYILKYNEATAFKTAGYTGDVPGLVQAEVAAIGGTAQAAADSILAQYAAWTALAASIETVRRTAKVAVNAATTTAAVTAAVTAATTGFTAIQNAAGAASSN